MVEKRDGPPPHEGREKFAWQVEMEFKVERSLDAPLRAAFEKAGLRASPQSTVSTTWIDRKYLPKGVSARIKKVSAGGKDRFFWALKKDAPNPPSTDSQEPEPAVKLEHEEEAPTEAKAIEALFGALASEFDVSIKMPSENPSSVFNTTIVKERVSFSCGEKQCSIGECVGVSFDFDVITAYAGEETKGALVDFPPESRVSILEIELIGPDSPQARAQVLSCAKKLGVTVGKEDAARSTKAIIRSRLHDLGYS